MLNHQLQWAFRGLALEDLPMILTNLEKLFRNRERGVWSIAFVGTLVLLLVLEQLQVLGTIHLENSEHYCEEIENGLYLQISQSFHLRFRTHRRDATQLNPFVSNSAEELDELIGPDGMKLVRCFKEDIFNNGKHYKLLKVVH